MALPLKKRPYRGRTYAPSAKRMRMLERQVYRNRPEMRTMTQSYGGTIAATSRFLFNPVDTIDTGNAVNNRSGDLIRVYRIEVRGSMSNILDGYILQKRGTTDPAYAYFGGTEGAYLLDNINSSQIIEWEHRKPSQVATKAPFIMSHRFKGGLLTRFNGTGTGACVDNEVVAVILNTTGAGLSADLTCRVWFTDA